VLFRSKDRHFLDDLDFWDIEEFEILMADVEKGKALPDILKEKEQVGYFKDSIRNYYVLKRGGFEKHSIIKEAFDALSEQAKDIFFRNKL